MPGTDHRDDEAFSPYSRQARIDPKPGTYYFIYFLNGFKFWESHPFTLSSWTSASNKNAGSLPNACSFVVRPHDGFTPRLRDHILQDRHGENDNQTWGTPVRVDIEAPYGNPHDLRYHDSGLLVIGGSGITVALAHVQLLCAVLNKNKPLQIRKVQPGLGCPGCSPVSEHLGARNLVLMAR